MYSNIVLYYVTVSQAWVGIPAAANISLQQTSCDVNKLEQQVNRVNQEFLRIKDGQENVGLDGVLESCTGPVTYPLHRRLNEFLIFAKPKVRGTLAAYYALITYHVFLYCCFVTTDWHDES